MNFFIFNEFPLLKASESLILCIFCLSLRLWELLPQTGGGLNWVLPSEDDMRLYVRQWDNKSSGR